jgi:hypothetical protein
LWPPCLFLITISRKLQKLIVGHLEFLRQLIEGNYRKLLVATRWFFYQKLKKMLSDRHAFSRWVIEE